MKRVDFSLEAVMRDTHVHNKELKKLMKLMVGSGGYVKTDEHDFSTKNHWDLARDRNRKRRIGGRRR
jgi:hypothetical protein